jgi:hypothetical protein
MSEPINPRFIHPIFGLSVFHVLTHIKVLCYHFLKKVTHSTTLAVLWVTFMGMKMQKTRKTKTGNEVSIVNGYLLFGEIPECKIGGNDFVEFLNDKYVKSIRVISLDYQPVMSFYSAGEGWLEYELKVEMTLRKEVRSGKDHWYGYRRVAGKLLKKYVGISEVITTELLVEVARKF